MIIWNTEYCYSKEKGITLVDGNHLIGGSHRHEEAIHFPTVRKVLKHLRTQYPNRLWRSKLTHFYGTIVEIQAGRKLEE